MYAPSNTFGYDHLLTSLNVGPGADAPTDIFMPEETITPQAPLEHPDWPGNPLMNIDPWEAEAMQQKAFEDAQRQQAERLQNQLELIDMETADRADRMQATRTWAADIEGAEALESATAQLDAARAGEGLE